MVKKEIRHFKLKVGSYTDIDASVPASVLSCLYKAKIISDPYFGKLNKSDVLSRGASFIGEFEVDAMMLGAENLLLSVGGIDKPAVILVNSVPVTALLPESVAAKIDIKSNLRLGKNTLEIRFAPVAESSERVINDVSIYAPVEIISYNKAIIENVVVRQTESVDKVRLDIEMTTSGYMRASRAVAMLVSPGGSVNYCTIIDGKGWMEIKNPGAWRIGRYGAHTLYKMTVNLYSDSELADTREYTLGLRTVSYDDESGVLSVSGVAVRPTLAIGGSLDAVKPRETRERCALMLRRAQECGIDMIYYDSDDRYPSSEYLSLCDTLGIGVAVKLITRARPGTEAELTLLRRDIERCFSYLGTHPSVIAIVGRSEYRELIEEAMARLLPSAVYIPRIVDTVAASPSLMSEYSSLKYFGDDERNILSASMDSRMPKRRDALIESVMRSYRMPRDFGEWTYLSGVISGTEAAAAYLSVMQEKSPALAPIAFLSETLPSISASVMDSSLRVKPMYHYISRYSRPAKAFATVEGGKIRFFITNLQTSVYSSKLAWSINDNRNKSILSDVVEFRVSPESTLEVYSFDAGDIIRGREEECYLRFFATDSLGAHSETTMFFVSPRRFRLIDPELYVDIIGANSDFTVTVSAKAYARAVELAFDPELELTLSDNYFDITSDVPVRLKLHTERHTAVEILKRTLSVRSLYDVGR